MINKSLYSRSQLLWLVVLRVLIGWYFLYEGLSKILAPNWSSYAYLRDSKGVFAPFFTMLTEHAFIMDMVNWINMYGLTAIGLCLISGLFVKFANIGAIVLLGMYYLSHPPLLDVHYLIRPEGYSLWVDKNLIILSAVVVLMLFSTSREIGLDRIIFNQNKIAKNKRSTTGCMMSQMDESENNESNKKTDTQTSVARREALKTIATLPVLGVMAYGVYQKKKKEYNNKLAGSIFNFEASPTVMGVRPDGRTIRLGIIGFGNRGNYLMQALGFATPQYIDNLKEQAKKDGQNTRYKDFLEQDDLNVQINGVCDIFEVYANDAALAGANIKREGSNGKFDKLPVIYKHYKDLLAADDIDAVIIATPDHWHGTMTIDAVKAGKHVYLEKPLTWIVSETYQVVDAVRKSGVVFQLGHQGRQIEVNHRAKDIIQKGLIGKVTLVEVNTNRNDPNGAWVYPIHPDASPSTIDWKQFVGDPKRIKEYLDYMTSVGAAKYVGPDAREKFSLERFFRWRCWWDYSTGLSGDLMTHEYDVMNHIMNLGIPASASSSGGIYHFKDGRTVPDVLQTIFEFPDKDMCLLYSATLASEFNRPRKIMGTDATIELGSSLNVTIDQRSERYKDKIQKGIIKPGEPFYRFVSGKNIDALSSATEKYFAERGLLFSYVEGKRYNTTYLHLREWLECIRQNKKPSCGIDEAFEEAMTAHMGTRAYFEGRTVYWDVDKQEITRG